jgi:hypothetical protein
LYQGPAAEGEFRAAEWLQLITFVLLITCFFVVGRWIYRASVNAHALRSEMTITPAWAVGWYFVPFANLVKPLHAMREIWLASHESDGSYDERVPILALWWIVDHNQHSRQCGLASRRTRSWANDRYDSGRLECSTLRGSDYDHARY